MKKIGIILLAYGSPENLDDMDDFLTHIRHGKALPEPAVLAFRKRYEETGGPSPLNRITKEQGVALALELKKHKFDFPVFIGMAHCKPWIDEAVLDAAQAGITHLIGIPMAPQFSGLSSGKYQRMFREAVGKLPSNQQMTISMIDRFFREDDFISFFVREVKKARAASTPVIFSAHSLPERILLEKDPYPDEILETATTIAERAGLSREEWHLAYQSKGMGSEPWLGPTIEEVCEKLSHHHRHVLVVPVGFVCDHIEILYDIDIDLRRTAKAWQVDITRTPSLNTDPLFISALGQVVRKHLLEQRLLP